MEDGRQPDNQSINQPTWKLVAIESSHHNQSDNMMEKQFKFTRGWCCHAYKFLFKSSPTLSGSPQDISFYSSFKRGLPSSHKERPANRVGGESDGGAAEEDAEAGHDEGGVEGGHPGNRPHLIASIYREEG